MLHLPEGKKPSRLPPLNYPLGGSASGAYAGGPPGLTQVPIAALPAGVDGSAAPIVNQPGFSSARETATQEYAEGSGGYTMVENVRYRWKMTAGKLELEKVPLTAFAPGMGQGLPQRPGGGVSLPPGAVVPRGMPIIGDSSGTERSWKACDESSYFGRLYAKQSDGTRGLDRNDRANVVFADRYRKGVVAMRLFKGVSGACQMVECFPAGKVGHQG